MNLSIACALRSIGAVGALALLAGAGCGSDTTNPGSSNSAALTGQSPSDPKGGGDSVTITAMLVGSDGRLTTLVDGPVTVNAAGRYTLPATVSAGATNQLIITAKAGAAVLGSVAIEGGFAAKGAFKVTPIDVSSTAAANLLVNAKSSGQWSAGFTLGEMRGLLGDDLAASLGTNQADLMARQAAAVMALAPIASWRGMLALGGVNEGQHVAALASIASAQATLDTQLDAAVGIAAKDAARAAFSAAFIKAHGTAGATVTQMAAASIAVADVANVYSANMEAGLRGQVLARAASIEADRINADIMGDFQALGAGQVSLTALTAASAALTTDISASASAGAGTQVALKAAWMKYGAVVEAQLATALTLSGEIGTAVKKAISADLTALTTARGKLDGSAMASVTTGADNAAIKQFMDAGLSHAALLTAGGATNAQAAAWLSATLEINAAGAVTP